MTTKNSDICSESSMLPKIILWFDIYNENHGVRNKARTVDFSKCSCPCELHFFIIDDNATAEPYGPFSADAILMHLNKIERLGQPPKRTVNQVLVAVEREAVPFYKINTETFKDAFNWSMTYRRDSDIFYPYGRIIPQNGKNIKKDYSKIYKEKEKGVIWFVSHCKTRSKRENYVTELRKYIEVDIYGDCGNLTCPRHGKESRRCLPELTKKYMFRLAFENTYHRDYVTEKFYDWFTSDMVQVVLGSANYSQIAPQGTYIDIEDFETPHQLASYLKAVMKDKEKYIGYLQRKENYTALTLEDSSQRAYCQLCTMLHSTRDYQKTYTNISEWWIS